MGLTRVQDGDLPVWDCPRCVSLAPSTGHVPSGGPSPEDETPPLDWAQSLASLKQSCPLIQRLPKSVRAPLAERLTAAIDLVMREPSAHSWWNFLTFPYRYLRSPDREASPTTTNASAILSSLNGDHTSLPHNASFEISQLFRNNSDNSRALLSKCRDGDVFAALRILTSEDTIAPHNDETLAALRSKHPHVPAPGELPELPEGSVCVPMTVDCDTVLEAIRSMKPGSGAGLDGMRPIHLQELLGQDTAERGRRLLSALTSLVNMVLRGNVPNYARDAFYGASLIALTKKDGGIRPIAVGSVYRRLASRLCARLVVSQTSDSLKPRQLGVGTPGGCEAAAHAARHFIYGVDHADVEEVTILVKIDIKNAFNTVERPKIFSKLLSKCPQVYSFMHQAYHSPTPLYFGRDKIESQTGLQQGDPMAPISFCLAIHDVISGLSSPFNVWFIDDGTVGGNLDRVLGDLSAISQGFAELGLQLNQAKCEVTVLGGPSAAAHRYAVDRVRAAMPNITETPVENLSLLGSPLGANSLESFARASTERVKMICRRLSPLDAHWALFFLSRYVSAPRINYLLRVAPMYTAGEELLIIDEIVRHCLSDHINVRLSDDAWKQASLPVRFGGLGVRSVSDLALPCFLASAHSAYELVSSILGHAGLAPDPLYTQAALDNFGQLYGGPDLPSGEGLFRQRDWDGIACRHRLDSLLQPSSQVNRARLLAASSPYSGAWLNATPVPSLGLHLSDAAVQVGVALRLGAPVCEPHLCRCQRWVDIFGHHGLSCRYSAGRLPRHANLNDVVKRALASAGIPSWLEPVGLDRGDGRRPDGVTVFPYYQGRSLCWDSTCVDTFCSSAVVDSAIAPGAAATRAEMRKREKYAGLADRYLFEPVSVETTGVLGASTAPFIRGLGRRITAQTGDRRETRWLFERLSLAVVRGNAASVLATGGSFL